MSAPLDLSRGWPNGPVDNTQGETFTYPIRLRAIVLDGFPDGQASNGALSIAAIGTGGYSKAELTGVESAVPAPTNDNDIATSASTPVTQNPSASANPDNVTGKIAYTRLNGSNLDMFVYDLASRSIIAHIPSSRQPDINGSLLVVNGQGNGQEVLFRSSITGENRRTVSKHTEDSHPQWSPSADSIVYASTQQGDGRWRLYWQRDASEQVEAPPMAYSGRELFGQYPIYLDNWRIAYQGCNSWAGGSSCGIYTTDTNGGKPNQVTDQPGDIPTGNLGNTILFMSKRNGNWEIYAINWDGSGYRQLTHQAARDGLATASPDNRHIAFMSDRDGEWAVYIMNTDGSNPFKAFSLGGAFGSGDLEWYRERISWGP